MTPAEQLAAAKKPPVPGRTGRLHAKCVWLCRIQELRTRLGLTLADVARAVGLSKARVGEIEFGADTSLSAARKLAAFFGVTVEMLWPERAEGGDS